MAQPFLLSRCFGKLRLVPTSSPDIHITRKISLSSVNNGKRNFRKFHLGSLRGTRHFKQLRAEGKYPDMLIETPVRPTGYYYGREHHIVPEMIPELIVPDLTGFELKPYVSYRTPKIAEDPFTAKDLFEAVYSAKIISDFEKGKITADGDSTEPSEQEKLTAKEAYQAARTTGCDIFSERIPKHWEFLEKSLLKEDNIKELE